ncbi:glycosyltransferase [Weizmannia acidilactici]|uniref:glycosyltransferase n=1 Tax=Weizmannia acidilactici TaxID=2607726 RepID=UPI00124F01E4|nr:glycosyltransferase family 2 protein [Weizmannia acidilactici]GER74420.1 glycosyl transferase [Weizmannia acidilactici]
MEESISMIILNYNSSSNTIRLAQDTLKICPLINIVIVDNNSKDEDIKKLELFGLTDIKIHLIKNNKNMGYAKGNNIGIKYAIDKLCSEYIIIANPDIEYNSKTIIINLVNELSSLNKDFACLTGIMLDCNKKVNLDRICWKLPGKISDFFANFRLLNKFFNPLRYHNLKMIADKNVITVDTIPGCFFIIRASAFQDINYFDEGTFLYCEERILAKKLANKNYKTGVLLSESFIHNHPKSNDFAKNLKLQNLLLKSRRYYNQNYNDSYKTNIFVKLILEFSFYGGQIENYLVYFCKKIKHYL